MTVKDLREYLDALRASVNDGEIEGVTVEDFEAIEVCVRVVDRRDGVEIASVAGLSSFDVEEEDADDDLALLVLEGVRT